MEIFTFGKYKGQKVSDVIQSNPSYVSWAHNNVANFNMTPQQIKEYNERMQTMYACYRKDEYSKWDDFGSDLECY